MEAIIIGATGAIGKVLVRQILCDDNYSKVTIFVRSAWELSHEKLHVVLVDFQNLNQYKEVIQGDIAFNCMGTTIKEAKKKQKMEVIDYYYPLAFAKICKENGINTFVNISSKGATKNSLFFYPKLKAKLENALKALNFEKLVIIRPSALIRPNSDRMGEKCMIKGLLLLNKIGLLTNSRPISVVKVADCMRVSAMTPTTGMVVIENNQI